MTLTTLGSIKGSIDEATRTRVLYVCWQRKDRLIRPVGRLIRFRDEEGLCYRFCYLRPAQEEQDRGDFRTIPGMPDLDRVYEDRELWPTFTRRMMSRRRPDYPEFVHLLGLSVEDDEFVVLGRSMGKMYTDRKIEVFGHPEGCEGSGLNAAFFVRGVRYHEEFDEAIHEVDAGDELSFRPEPKNSWNPRALLVCRQDGEPVGRVPDYWLETIHDLLSRVSASEVRLTAERVNPPDTAPYLRLLCRLRAPWPAGFEPLSDSNFISLADGSTAQSELSPSPVAAAG